MGTTPEYARLPYRYLGEPQIDEVGRGAFSRGRYASDESLMRMFETHGPNSVIRSIISAIRRSPEPYVQRYVATGDADMARGDQTHGLRWAIDLDANVRRIAYTSGYLERVIADIATAPAQTITWSLRDGRPYGDVPLPHWMDRIQALLDAMAKLRGDPQFTSSVRTHLVKVLADSASVVLDRLYRERQLVQACARCSTGKDAMFTLIVWAGQANDWNGIDGLVSIPRAVDVFANMVVDCIDFFRDDYEMVGQIFAALRSTYYSPKLDDMLTLPPAPLWARLQEPVELFATLVGGLKVDTIRHHAPSTIADMLQAIRPSDEALVVGWLRESRRALDLLLDAVLQLGTHASFRSIPMRLNPHHEDEIRARVFCTLRNFIATPANALRLAVESGLLAAIAPKPGPHSVAHVVALLDDLRSRLDSVRASLRPRLGAAAGVAMAVLRGYGPNERAVRERWFALVRAFDLDAADEALRMCGGCGVTGRDGKLWRCGGCGKRWSCSRSCQRLDWGSHRKRCSGARTP